MKEKGLQIQAIEDPEGPVTETVVVSPDAIPSTIEERLLAPSIALLPNRTGYPEMQGEIPLPSGEKEAIKSAAEQFLKAWETYRPGQKSYEPSLRELVSLEELPSIVLREDSTDPPDVCPEASCKKGSRWYDTPRFSDSAFIIDQQGSRVFLVAYGAVSYESDIAQESSSERSYGIIMRKDGSNWLVERAAAESLR